MRGRKGGAGADVQGQLRSKGGVACKHGRWWATAPSWAARACVCEAKMGRQAAGRVWGDRACEERKGRREGWLGHQQVERGRKGMEEAGRPEEAWAFGPK